MRLIALAFLLLVPPMVRGEVLMPAVFSDGMVLQRDAPIQVWGSGADGERIEVSLGNDRVSATASKGAWRATLPPRPAGGPFEMTVRSGRAQVLHDVMVGDVWLCSGQSNMVQPLSRSTTPVSSLPGSTFEGLRLFSMPRKPSGQGRDAGWRSASPATAERFPGNCLLFGADLKQHEKVTVGLISAAVGSTPIQAWLAEATGAPPITDRRNAAQRKAGKQRRLAGSELFNAMIQPLVPYRLRGVVWYQGEANKPNADAYAEMLARLIGGWRAAWGDEKLPFVVVQLPGYGSQAVAFQAASDWARLRDGQRRATDKLPHTALAVLADVGDGEIHPRDKQAIAKRITAAALALEYGENRLQTPKPRTAQGVAGGARITFDEACLELRAPAEGAFQVLDESGGWRPAKAAVKGNQVELASEGGAKVKEVRYAWSNFPALTLFSCAGIPAPTFAVEVE